MAQNSWPENDSFSELESSGALVVHLDDDESGLGDLPPLPRFAGRRLKSAAVLSAVWGGTIALHSVTWGHLFVLMMTTVMSVHIFRAWLARPVPPPSPLADATRDQWPLVSLMVSAKNEEAVIGKLVMMLCQLDYPADRYEVWIIDDNSSDNTPVVLEQFAGQYQQLRVFRRAANAGGGKSGALNQVLPLTKGEIIVVFDADAQVQADFLQQVLPLFDRERVGAVQMRKATIAHPEDARNFWIQGQMAEMTFDAFMQQQRIAIGGLGELRGNGQFVRRTALEQCGGWNEETITDDLDLTIQLHLNQWDIDCVMLPPVEEEGVTSALPLWHQRNRWVEGGYQRYLDYWRLIVRNRMGTRKTLDLFVFWMTQYILPTAAVPDALMAIVRNRPMLLSPLSSLTITLCLFGMMRGLRRVKRMSATHDWDLPFLMIVLQSLRGTLYMLHWLPIVGSTTFRMAIRPKRLKWVKTIHKGAGESEG
jgi:1,2-diacylglycerol 3-beta-glucosyltransferase